MYNYQYSKGSFCRTRALLAYATHVLKPTLSGKPLTKSLSALVTWVSDEKQSDKGILL